MKTEPLPRVLAPLIATSQERVKALRAAPPPAASAKRRDFMKALKRLDRISVIAEIKRASPSSGSLRPEAEPARIASTLAGAGADALSILTEPTAFGGSIEDLTAARSACRLPVLRKDFLVDPIQVEEAAAAGADAVLLILRCLDDATAESLMDRAQDLKLACLVETHTAEEIRRALALGANIIGVNARDLDTLAIDLPKALDLLNTIPASKALRIIESGLGSRDDLVRAQEAGADAALIGTALMKAPDPAEALKELLP